MSYRSITLAGSAGIARTNVENKTGEIGHSPATRMCSRRAQSLSKVFFRIAYPVEPFGFKFVSSRPLFFSFESHREGLRQRTDIPGKLNNREAEEFQMVHWGDQHFSSPQNARYGKKGALATISVFVSPYL